MRRALLRAWADTPDGHMVPTVTVGCMGTDVFRKEAHPLVYRAQKCLGDLGHWTDTDHACTCTPPVPMEHCSLYVRVAHILPDGTRTPSTARFVLPSTVMALSQLLRARYRACHSLAHVLAVLAEPMTPALAIVGLVSPLATSSLTEALILSAHHLERGRSLHSVLKLLAKMDIVGPVSWYATSVMHMMLEYATLARCVNSQERLPLLFFLLQLADHNTEAKANLRLVMKGAVTSDGQKQSSNILNNKELWPPALQARLNLISSQ